jgi:hypothetical protein
LVVAGNLILEQGLGSRFPLGVQFFAHRLPRAVGNSGYIFCSQQDFLGDAVDIGVCRAVIHDTGA